MLLVVTTCALRGAGYLRALVQQVEEAGAEGWSGPRLVVSDGPPPFETGWPTDASPAPVGQKRTYWRALTHGIESARRAGADQFLVLEDDVELCRTPSPTFARMTVPAGFDFISSFDGHAVPAAPGRAFTQSPPRASLVCKR